MNDSIYAPPKADLSVSSYSGSDGDNAFYVVSPLKFSVLFFVTLGGYQLFWMYKNWSSYKDRCRFADSSDRNIWPIARALFSIFFIHSLFYKVDAYAEEKARPLSWNVDTNATIMVLLLIATGIFGQLPNHQIGTPYTTIAWMLLLVCLHFSLRKAQGYINASCGDPEGLSNSEFTAANWVWIVLGTIICLLAIVGMFLPQPGA
jgi:hypothetical protein